MNSLTSGLKSERATGLVLILSVIRGARRFRPVVMATNREGYDSG